MYKLEAIKSYSNYILTNHGYKQFHDIIYNDKIYDHRTGTYKQIKKITDTTTKIDDTILPSTLYMTTFTKYTIPITIPDSYKYMVKYIHPNHSANEIFDILRSNETIEWVSTHELQKGHILAIPLHHQYKKQHKNISILQNNKIVSHTLNHSRLWFLFGYFLHYGIFDANPNYQYCIQLTIYDSKEEELLHYLDEFIISIPTIFSNGLNDACVYRICLDESTYQLLQYFIDKKTIPEWVLSSTRFYLYTFIHGFLYNVHGIQSAYNTNSFMYTWSMKSKELVLKNINIELLLSLQLILFKCDIVNSIHVENRKTYNVYKMIIYKEKKENEFFPFFSSNYVWVPYVKKEPTNQSSTTKDTCITIKSTGSYIVNNLMMNYAPSPDEFSQ